MTGSRPGKSNHHGYDTIGIDGRKRSETANPKSSARAGRRPVEPETRKAIEDMAREGTRSRNQVAREFGVAPSTVTLICREAEPPITFDRSKTEVAVKAHQIDLKAKRAELAELLLLDAFVLREAALKDKVVRILTEGMVEDGVTDPVEFEVEREGRDIQARYTALGIAVDKHMVIVRADSDDRDLPAVEVFLRGQGVPSLFGGGS